MNHILSGSSLDICTMYRVLTSLAKPPLISQPVFRSSEAVLNACSWFLTCRMSKCGTSSNACITENVDGVSTTFTLTQFQPGYRAAVTAMRLVDLSSRGSNKLPMPLRFGLTKVSSSRVGQCVPTSALVMPWDASQMWKSISFSSSSSS